jgi:hypothetical protein
MQATMPESTKVPLQTSASAQQAWQGAVLIVTR